MDRRCCVTGPSKKDTPGEAHDHIHHQGIFIGHERISGANFWHIDRPNSGSIEQRRLIESRSGNDRALIKTLNWKNKQGERPWLLIPAHSPFLEIQIPVPLIWNFFSMLMDPCKLTRLRMGSLPSALIQIFASKPVQRMA